MDNDKPLSKRVEVKIKALIAEGCLKIGERLPSERDLASAMNVSRPTVREAIRSMESAGLLKSSPGSGTFVIATLEEVAAGLAERPKPSIFDDNQRITDIIQLRWTLEPSIAAMAANNATKAGLKELQDNLKAQKEAVDTPTGETWARADLDFHLLLARLTGNPLYLRVMENLSNCIAICVDASHFNPARMKVYYDAHMAIYRAIADHDVKKAIFSMEEHLKMLPWQENLRVSTVIYDE